MARTQEEIEEAIDGIFDNMDLLLEALASYKTKLIELEKKIEAMQDQINKAGQDASYARNMIDPIG